MASVQRCIVFCVCTLATWNLGSGLQPNGVNVDSYTTYRVSHYTTKCGWLIFKWKRCSRYRKRSVTNYRCKTGYRSTDGRGCPYPVCDNEIRSAACNIDYRTSHIVYSNGMKQYKSGGSCTSPGICSNCNEGFYSSLERCRMCSAISNCDLETCTSGSDQVCSRCEGVVQPKEGHRAYVVSSDERSCIQACSWRSDSTRCFPGTCRNEYASNCVCSSDFTGKHCQTITTKPTINSNLLRLTASNGDTTEAPPDINSGPSQSTSWSNINYPNRTYHEFTAEYKIVPPSRHAFIEDFRVGIVSGSATFKLKRGAGIVSTKAYTCRGASRSSPDRDLYTCHGKPSGLSLPFQHRDVIEFTYSASNGGYVKVRNKESNTLTTYYYNGATQTHTFTLSIDLVDPYHCTGTTACVGSMLTVPDVIKTSTVNIRWSGWSDADAGIDHYVREVYELHAVDDVLRDERRVDTTTLSSSTTSNSYTLTEAGVYSVVLAAYDKAGNHRSARRILIYDGTSTVTTQVNTSLSVTTTSSATSEWHTTSSAVTVDWTNRYINTFHHNNKWLLRVASVRDIGLDYDDNDGDRSVASINNVQGVTRFLSSYKVDHQGGSSITSPPADNLFTSQGLNQSQTITPSLVDGDTVRFWVRSYDIRREFLEEHVTVNIDTSPPVIENLWLTKGDRLNISVHSAEEFSEMTMEWIAYDEHSGLETVSWRLVDKYQGLDIVHGVQHITAQGESTSITDCKSTNTDAPRGANCYCTPVKGCYHRHFQVKPIVVDSSLQHGGIFSNKSKGSHDSDYHLEVTVTNHAKLTTKMEYKVTIDTSPPNPGVVHDGHFGNPEVDYQQHLQLSSHWDGFFDKESGVKFYQYKFGPHCLSSSEFGVNRSSFEITETYSTSASWTAPSVGRYHVTVIAFNRALEASDPVCSDGVTVDTTPPSVSEVAVRDSRVMEGLVKSDNVVWYIDVYRKRSLVVSPDDRCSSKATPVDDKRLSIFPIHRYHNGSGMQLHNPECGSLLALPVSFINSLYLYREHNLFVNWTGSDSESGIYDYELGLMSDPSGEAAPDIMPYTSTHHHPQYQGYHPRLSEGQQFYITIKAINKAGISTVRVVGPVTVYTRYPASTGSMAVTLRHNYLVARWPETAFTDTGYLKYKAAIGTKDGKSTMIPFRTLQSGGGCTLTSPPTCTAVALTDLHWDLHHKHTYFVSVRVTNIVGLSTVAVSQPYVHNVMLPLRGVVEDVIPPEEETLFRVPGTGDTDYQISTRTLTARWYGFDSGITAITYRVGLGSQPFATDILGHVHVGNATSHSFSDLSLHWKTKYFVTVVASTGGGGDVTVSSDGVTVIRPNVDITDVIVRDGQACNDSVNGAFRSAVNQTRCSRDNTYQVSTSSYAAHWNASNWLLSYPDVQWSLQKKVLRTDDLWDTEREFEPVGTSDMVVSSSLSLEPGTTYRAAVKFCVGNVCSKPIYSDGVTVIAHPPIYGNISLTYRESDSGEAQIQVRMNRFRDPDIKVLQEAYDVMDRYEWGLTDDSHNHNMLLDWQTVDADAIESVTDDKIRFTLNLPELLDFTKCRRVSVRGYNHAGLHTTVSADVKECAAYDPPNIVPAVVLDVIGESIENFGQEITLDQSSYWHDVDYTPHKNILSAVWPTLRHRNYTWAVVAGDQLDPTSHYKRESLMTVTDPCSMPDVIKCGHTANEFINVQFAEQSYLQHGRRFYVCIHADDKNTHFEKWTSHLTEVNVCSDGITVDLTPPTPGTVNVENLVDGTFQVSKTEVAIRWAGFTDVEEERFSAHAAGIAFYEVALGTFPAGQDVVTYTRVGYVDKYILHRLSLHTGSTYYVTVRATDFVKKTTVAVSGGFLVDATPPVLTGQHIEVEDRYITSRLIHVCWKNVFSDEESGTKSYIVAMGTRHAYADVSEYMMTVEDCLVIDTLNKTEDGHEYYITVKAVNGAGLYTLSSSRPVVVDTTPPSTGYVYDGIQSSDDDRDKDYVTSVSEMAAHWEGFDDPHSSVAMYKVKVGTCKGCDDKMNEAKTGLHQHISLQHILVSPGVKYFITVTACNTGGLCSSSSSSDGVILDSSPPVPGTVQDGTGDVDIQFQATRTFIGCKWRDFSDPESGLDHYQWRVGTKPGADDILSARTAALGEVIFHTLKRDQQLPVGRTLYSTIRAYNKAGLYSEAGSNGLLVDDSVPIVVTPPTVRSLMSLVPNTTTVSRTALSLHWAFQDVESSIERQYLSLSSHQLGEIDSSNLEVKVPGFLREYTFVNLDLHDGSIYKLKVTACNMAGLCVSANANNILVDSSKPNTGTFAIETDHAVKLPRHQPGWMTWNRTSLNLAWLGFSDLHSGISYYLVTVGSHEFGTDFNTGTQPEKVFHNDSGVNKGDEGVLQRFTVPTRTLPSSGSVFVAIWGVNGVGLQSDAYHAELVLEADSTLWLVRRCQAYNCEGHCVCAVHGGTCSASKACIEDKTDGADKNITIKDVVDFLSPDGSKDVDVSLFSTVMAATWVDSFREPPVSRYEYSIGESDEPFPVGVFDPTTERVWFDAGLQTSAFVSLPAGKSLISGVKYSFFLRAWYNKTYNIFKSDGVLIQTAPPTVTVKAGNAVKELAHQTGTKDTDFQTQKETLFVQWSGKFLQGQSGLLRYRLFISTVQGGHSLHESGDLTSTSYRATGLSLRPNTVYYCSVLAYNKAGLVSWAYSDGVQVDVMPPVAGTVKDGHDIHDVDYQSSISKVSASWYGFSDTDSTIVKYFWCVGTINDTSDCSVMDWLDTGLHTSSQRSLLSPVANGTRIWSKVYAVDAVGYTSDVAVSDGVVTDASPPERQDVAYLGDNLVKNPSFEVDDITGSTTPCNLVIPTSWETNTASCIKVQAPDAPLAKDGHMFVSVSGSIQQTISGLEVGRQYKLTLHAGYPETVSNTHRSVDAIVTIGSEVFSFILEPNFCRGTCGVGDHSVVLWNKHTYRFTAADTNLVLKISSSSRMMEFVLEFVSVQTVDYVAGPDNVDTEGHLVVHSVFLSHWSSLHASWHFEDQQSPITQYKWAIGTTPGGTQVQGYTDLGRDTQGTLYNVQLLHGTSVYITVMATNAAGLSAVTYSDVLTVDMTAPQFDLISDGLDGQDTDYQTSGVVSVYWQVRDEESGVEHCDWAIGRTRGSSDVKPFERVTQGESTSQHDVTSKLHAWPVTVYSTVRCFNKAGLASVMTSDGVEVVPTRNQTSVPGFSVLRESQSVYSERDVCHQSQEKVRLRWDKTSRHFKTAIGIEGDTLTKQNVIPVELEYTFATLMGVRLKDGSTYHSLGFSIDGMGTHGDTTMLNFTVHRIPPVIRASGRLSVVKSGNRLNVAWRNMFASPWDEMTYEVHVGTVLGGANIVDKLLTENDEITLIINSQYRGSDKIYVSLTAIDTCGLSTWSTHTVSLN